MNIKEKGTKWERDAVKILNYNIKNGNFKRVPSSGAIGTILNENILTGDIRGSVPSIPRNFKIECKTGYGGFKQMVIKKEWLDKITEESLRDLTIPILLGKFSGAKEGVKYFAVIDLETLVYLINYITSLHESME